MIEIIYQNNRNGEAVELSTIMSSLTIDTKLAGTPSKVDISLLKEYQTKISFEMGSIIAIKVDGKGIFYGYLFKVDTTDDTVQLTFYDQLRYLVANASYVFRGEKLQTIIKTIANDFSLKIGYLENSKRIINPLISDNKKILDIILTVMDELLVYEKQLYVLFDNFGKLEVRKPEDMILPYVIGDGSLMSSFSHTRSIEDSYNFIKIIKDNKESGQREAYIVKDSGTMNYWGKLQFFETADDKLNSAQITDRAEQLLSLHNREKETLSLDGIGNIEFRSGRACYVELKDIEKKGFYIIEEAKHSFKGDQHTMNIKLRTV